MKFTRREILAAFLGTPFALSACRLDSPSRFPQGEIVGQNVSFGHILRENRNFEVRPDNWSAAKVAIIGGGVAGLTAAWKFKKESFNDFVLLELEKEIGGTSQS